MIRVNNILKKYSDKIILENINLELPKNKITAFIGSNGAGKSTLISIISRTLAKDSGEVFIDEKELKNWNTTELSKRLSILKQSNHLNIKLTVRELINFGRFPHSKGKLTKEDVKKVDEAIEYMDLSDLENRYIDELSGGQRQMAYIAMIIAQDTDYIFLDEPLNNLDIKHILEVMHLLKKLVEEQNKTIILVVHDINIASTFADYIVAMKNGEIIESGLTEDIINNEILYKIYEINFQIENFS